MAGTGVMLFFAISGFLITTRILEEEAACGRFNVRAFYIRRVLRIQPAALVFLLVIAILTLSGVIFCGWRQWLSALLLYQNFTNLTHVTARQVIFVGHFWTLSVEEHFYILLSLALFFIRKRRILLLGAMYLISAEVLRYGVVSGHFNPANQRYTWWQLHFLLLPAFIASLMRVQNIKSAVQRFLKPWVAAILTIPLPMLHLWQSNLRHSRPTHIHDFVGEFYTYVVPYGFILWIVSTAFHPTSLATRFLENRQLRFIGRISYSLYLWHILFFNRMTPETTVTNPVLSALSGSPQKYIASLAVAALSYYFIEKPFIRLGHRLAPPATPGRIDLDQAPAAKTA